ncbi:hypothetical protein HDU98_001706, partial [Podochytrium sp. JEL0797]
MPPILTFLEPPLATGPSHNHGTREPPFAAIECTTTKGGKLLAETVQNICAMKAYAAWSQEELRITDYALSTHRPRRYHAFVRFAPPKPRTNPKLSEPSTLALRNPLPNPSTLALPSSSTLTPSLTLPLTHSPAPRTTLFARVPSPLKNKVDTAEDNDDGDATPTQGSVHVPVSAKRLSDAMGALAALESKDEGPEQSLTPRTCRRDLGATDLAVSAELRGALKEEQEPKPSETNSPAKEAEQVCGDSKVTEKQHPPPTRHHTHDTPHDAFLFDSMGSHLDAEDEEGEQVHQPIIQVTNAPQEPWDPVDFLRVTTHTVNSGTGNPTYAITEVLDAGKLDKYMTVSCMRAYSNWSPEELRVQDYTSAKPYAPLSFSHMPSATPLTFWPLVSKIQHLHTSLGSQHLVRPAIAWLLECKTVVWDAMARMTEIEGAPETFKKACRELLSEEEMSKVTDLMQELGGVMRCEVGDEEYENEGGLVAELLRAVDEIECVRILEMEFGEIVAKAIKNRNKKSKKVSFSDVGYECLDFLHIPYPGTIAAVESVLPDLKSQLKRLLVEAAESFSAFGIRHLVLSAVQKFRERETQDAESLEKAEDNPETVAVQADELLESSVMPASVAPSAEFETLVRDQPKVTPPVNNEPINVLQPIEQDPVPPVLVALDPPANETEPAVEYEEFQPLLPLATQALHATCLDGAAWEVCLGDRAQAGFKAVGANGGEAVLGNVFVAVMRIARGEWFGDEGLCGGGGAGGKEGGRVPMWEAKVADDLFLLWQVDVTFLELTQTHSQLIKLWGLGPRSEVDKIRTNVVAVQKTYSPERVRRCLARFLAAGANLVFPVVFDDDGGDAGRMLQCDEEEEGVDSLVLCEMAVTAKFIPLSMGFVSSLLVDEAGKGEGREFPFMLSRGEDEIVKRQGSVVVVGRSGTGKTSCSVFRMLDMFFTYVAGGRHQRQAAALRQIFVTASPEFCLRVKNYFARLVKGVGVGGGEGDAAQRVQEFLGKVKTCYESGTAFVDPDAGVTEVVREVQEFVARDESVELFEEGIGDGVAGAGDDATVPASLLQLEDRHFPLFLTYKKFSSMLRNTVGVEGGVQDVAGLFDESVDLEYHTFLHKRWRHMNAKLTHKMDPALVFNEIMGVVKGSVGAARAEKGCLSRDEYVALNERSYGSFKGEVQRGRMYDLFVEYERVKGEEMDAMDRVNESNRAMSQTRYTGPPIHEIFVDEVQDLTMAQLLPLVSICANPERGLMFAGDTAQTISRGSAFRFQALTSMIYGVLEERAGKEFAGRHRPVQYQLTRN